MAQTSALRWRGCGIASPDRATVSNVMAGPVRLFAMLFAARLASRNLVDDVVPIVDERGSHTVHPEKCRGQEAALLMGCRDVVVWAASAADMLHCA
jgi:hypothetical protein